MTKLIRQSLFAIIIVLAISGCSLNSRKSNSENVEGNFFRKEIAYGMAQDEIETLLGAPKLVSKNGLNQETWIYDKYASNVSYSTVSERAASGEKAISKKLIMTGFKPSTGVQKVDGNLMAVEVNFGTDKKVVGFNYYPSLH